MGVSGSANQGLHLRNFLFMQGYRIPPVNVYQDNKSCMVLIARGQSVVESTWHVAIRYFWVKERVDNSNSEMRIEHKCTKEMYANVLEGFSIGL